MPALNPFLKAFFRSTLPAQCNPLSNYVSESSHVPVPPNPPQILLVPTTEALLTSIDRESSLPYEELTESEDFLASHVLRVSGSLGPGMGRDLKSKVKQYTTLNNHTLVVKETFIYSNKGTANLHSERESSSYLLGFKNLIQSQLLTDEFYYPNTVDIQPWLVYYISKPLIGLQEPRISNEAVIPNDGQLEAEEPSRTAQDLVPSPTQSTSKKRSISSFKDVLTEFPLIARHMQSGLEKIFKDFQTHVHNSGGTSGADVEDAGERRVSVSSASSSVVSSHTYGSNGHPKAPSSSTLSLGKEEYRARHELETAVNAAVEMFQQVDKQQLSYLGTSTDLTGPAVERLIEQYILEHVHDSILFPILCESRGSEDKRLEGHIRQMEHIDIAQVGISFKDSLSNKNDLAKRLELGLQEFRKLGVAGSPYQMLKIMLTTQKLIAHVDISPKGANNTEASDEKGTSVTNMNADTLVSLLLVVVVRAQISHLHARLMYMRNFVFADDVESGETGYALSTFEAVLTYLASDEGGLRKASRLNRRLWQAAQKGRLDEVRALLDPKDSANEDEYPSTGTNLYDDSVNLQDSQQKEDLQQPPPHTPPSDVNTEGHVQGSNLAHVFPFQNIVDNSGTQTPEPKPRKRVSMNLRSLSISSDRSWHSRTTTIASANSAIEGDVSAAMLAQTQNIEGKSVLMLATESRQPEILDYLLGLEDFYPIKFVLEDTDYEGTTLLSAAIQAGHSQLIDLLLRRLSTVPDQKAIPTYLAQSDKRGRTAAHYFFNAPGLILRLGHLVPWRQKDKNGQTPLLALCRCYDHSQYLEMVEDALYFATREQNDAQPLHLDNHTDAKGNTLLHIVNEPNLAVHILRHCDCNPNGPNLKRFTPLMTASKFGRLDMVRAFFGDRRVDIRAREIRGMTAVELAKDDEVRNRIDDMILVSNVPGPDGRVTAVVRAFLAEEDPIRLIIKSAIRNNNGMISVTTCRRSLVDFENLANWLNGENPASWLPSIFNFRSPFQIPSKPSRAALSDIQVRLDRFLKIMLTHSTFSTHALLYEFVLFPEIQPEMMADRSRRRVEIRPDNIREEYEPVTDIRGVESFVSYARDSVRGVDQNLKAVARRVVNIRNITHDHYTAFNLLTQSLSTLPFLPQEPYIQGLTRLTACYQTPESDPHKLFFQDLLALLSTTISILSSLSRPHQLITQLSTIQRTIDRQSSSLRRSDRGWPLGLLEDTRKTMQAEALTRAKKSQDELRQVGCELAYTQQTVAQELAGWQELHAKLGRRGIRELGQRMVIREKDRLAQMRSAVREVVGTSSRLVKESDMAGGLED